MFKIYDGRKEFYQWDLDRKLIVEDKTISEVHFCNRMGAVSVIRYVYEVNGMYLVDVPNILLQDSFRMNVYGYDKNYTKHSKNFNVVARTRPENYVFTDEEVNSWKELDERINNIEKEAVPEAVIETVVQEYLDTHPTVDLTGYATEDFVREAVGAIDIPEVDLTDYYTKSETKKLVENDLAYYATKSFVEQEIGKIEIPSTEGLATEAFVTQKIAEAELGGQDVDLSDYYTKGQTDKAIEDAVGAIEIPEVPTLDGYATEQFVSEAIGAIDFPETDLSDYALKTEIPDVTGFTTMGAVEAKGYQTEAQVNSLINAALGVIENGSY